MSAIGPRPLLVQYLPRYNEQQHRRHEVRPGLSGYAQVHGRNTIGGEGNPFRISLVDFVESFFTAHKNVLSV